MSREACFARNGALFLLLFPASEKPLSVARTSSRCHPAPSPAHLFLSRPSAIKPAALSNEGLQQVRTLRRAVATVYMLSASRSSEALPQFAFHSFFLRILVDFDGSTLIRVLQAASRAPRNLCRRQVQYNSSFPSSTFYSPSNVSFLVVSRQWLLCVFHRNVSCVIKIR